MAFQQQIWRSRSAWLWILICGPLLLSLVDCLRDFYSDLAMIRAVALRSEIGQLRSQLIRHAGRLEALLDVSVGPGQKKEDRVSSLRDKPWLAARWKALSKPVGNEVYLAMVDSTGIIVMHTDPAVVGRRLTSEWDDHKEPDAGNNVVRIDGSPLVGGKPAYDVNVPIFVDRNQIGRLHSGLDAAWFDDRVAAQQQGLFWSRGWFVALIVAANLGAVGGLVLLSRDHVSLRRKLAQIVCEQSQRLSQIGMGLAHEIRNPLNALRLNLYALKRSLGGTAFTEQQVSEIMRESSDEIDRLDALIRDFVQYTVPQSSGGGATDVTREVQATLQLIGEELRQKKVELKTQFVREPVSVRIDPARLRHITLNLLTFAEKSAGENGLIEVSIQRAKSTVELVIADSGRQLTDNDQARLFEPFQSTVHSEAGLGLALTSRFAMEAGGSVVRRTGHGKNCFRVLLPLATRALQETST